jgi:hypothetical protein
MPLCSIVEPPSGECVLDLPCRTGPGEKIALHLIARMAAKKFKLLSRL